VKKLLSLSGNLWKVRLEDGIKKFHNVNRNRLPDVVVFSERNKKVVEELGMKDGRLGVSVNLTGDNFDFDLDVIFSDEIRGGEFELRFVT